MDMLRPFAALNSGKKSCLLRRIQHYIFQNMRLEVSFLESNGVSARRESGDVESSRFIGLKRFLPILLVKCELDKDLRKGFFSRILA